jgi:uncharacterized protein YidB (DUF937 family)
LAAASGGADSANGAEMDLSALTKLAGNPQVRNLVMSLLGSTGGTKSGGAQMTGLLDNLQGNGLQDQVKSWVGTGENKPVTASEITQAIGPDKLAGAARDAGLSTQEAAEDLARVLPQIVDTASPAGQAPAAADFDQMFAKLFDK